MTYAVTIVAGLAAGLGLVLGTGALAEDARAPADDLAQIDLVPSPLPETEVAFGSSVAPLGTPTSRAPLFVVMDEGAPSLSSSVSAQVDQPEPPAIGTSGLMAFGAEGVRLPAYEPDIATGSVTITPRR